MPYLDINIARFTMGTVLSRTFLSGLLYQDYFIKNFFMNNAQGRPRVPDVR